MLFSQSIERAGGNIVTSAQLCWSGRFAEQLLNNWSFEILSEPTMFTQADTLIKILDIIM